ncbi:MAG TPA: glycosyltransferase family 4 protein [Syntrophomonadaceae bacterium]|nr:glycosyltransferase family 4 protein [Syntrophomonadaceae bacterium]
MRIGIFTDSYKPYTSGVVTSISTFKEELTRLGHEVHIFAPSYPNYTDTEENVYRYYSVPSPTNPDYTLAIPVYPGMNLLIKKLQLDIIHVHSPFTMGRVGLHYARKYYLPLVFTYHTRYDQYVHYVPVAQDLAKDMTIKYSRQFCNSCDHVIAPSPEIKQMVEDAGVKTPVSVIPTGVPLYRFENGDDTWLRRHYSIPEQNKILLFVGRLTKEKNLFFLLDSFKLAREQLPNLTLVLTAQGPLETELKNYAQRLGFSLDRDVIFTGALPFDTLVHVYFSADLFVFSSLTETQGLVLIEAMAAGLPVVAVRASGVQDMVDHGVDGILTACDRKELAEAICQVISDPHMYQRLQAGAIKKANLLSSRTQALKLERIYQHLLDGRRYRPGRSWDFGSWFGM